MATSILSRLPANWPKTGACKTVPADHAPIEKQKHTRKKGQKKQEWIPKQPVQPKETEPTAVIPKVVNQVDQPSSSTIEDEQGQIHSKDRGKAKMDQLRKPSQTEVMERILTQNRFGALRIQPEVTTNTVGGTSTPIVQNPHDFRIMEH